MKAAQQTPSTFNATTRQFSETAGIGYQEASSLTRLLVQLGAVLDTGEVIPPASGKGKGSKVFTYPQQVVLDFVASDGDGT